MDDLISRRAAIDDIETVNPSMPLSVKWVKNWVKTLPSAQPERDIPMKPNETIDSAWGIRKKQAVCPKCDYYLPRIYFLGYSKNEKVTYCETCGQAIDWEGWEWEE